MITHIAGKYNNQKCGNFVGKFTKRTVAAGRAPGKEGAAGTIVGPAARDQWANWLL